LRAFKGKGCNECNNTGMAGRNGIYEVMPITPAIEQMILARASDTEIRNQAIKEGMLTLRMAAVDKMKNGITTVDEVFAITS